MREVQMAGGHGVSLSPLLQKCHHAQGSLAAAYQLDTLPLLCPLLHCSPSHSPLHLAVLQTQPPSTSPWPLGDANTLSLCLATPV